MIALLKVPTTGHSNYGACGPRLTAEATLIWGPCGDRTLSMTLRSLASAQHLPQLDADVFQGVPQDHFATGHQAKHIAGFAEALNETMISTSRLTLPEARGCQFVPAASRVQSLRFARWAMS